MLPRGRRTYDEGKDDVAEIPLLAGHDAVL
jgi:hypothetical protein